MRIMIVEDEQRARRGLHSLIESISEKYEIVAEASDGKQALEMIPVVNPEVVFTDLKMPHMDGMSLIKAVRAMERDIKFVIITAYEEFDIARQAISLEVSDYLVKPVTYDETAQLLERLMAKGNTAPDTRVKSLMEEYPKAHPLVIKALNILEKSYSTRISQKELAENLGITQEYFSYLFNKDMGEPFSKFLRKYRIQAAKCLYQSADLPREEVPFRVGFSDSKYFNKVFREVEGISVSDYLKKFPQS